MEGEKFLKDFKILQEYLNNIWNEIGFSIKEKEEKEQHIAAALMGHLKEIKEKEVKIREKLIKSIDEAMIRLHQLSNDLNAPVAAEPKNDMTLINLEKYLEEQLNIYEKEAQERIDSLKVLQLKENDLCKRLGEEPMHVPCTRVPSKETLEHLFKIIKTVEMETEHRQKTFQSLRALILAHMEELELKPATSLERDLLIDSDELVVLSKQTLQKMKSLSNELQQKVEACKEKERKLKDEVHLLWDRLSIDEERREFFHNELSWSTVENISKLEAELKDLEQLKHQNMGRFINQMKRELEELWEKCFISEDEKEDFTPYFSDEYSEKNLEQHETEVARLKEFYSQNENIFLRITKWQELWKKVIELDEKASDPARLFGNRGCALLQEEKERKRVNKELPRAEHELGQILKVWEKENGRLFLISGRTLSDFIKSQWQEYNEKKILEKYKRQTARNKRLQVDAQLGTSRTPQRKRQIFQSEIQRTSKYLRTNENEKTPSNSTSGTNVTRSSSAISPKTSRTTRPLRKAAIREQPSFQGIHQSTFNSTEVSSYDKFSDGIQRLSKRENIRSSVVPPKYLANKSPRNTIARGPRGLPKTPLSTIRSIKPNSPASASKRQPLCPNYQANNYRYFSSPKVPSSLPRRRSARLINSSKSFFASSRNTPSPGMHSQKSGLAAMKLTTPIRNRLNFFM